MSGIPLKDIKPNNHIADTSWVDEWVRRLKEELPANVEEQVEEDKDNGKEDI